MHPDDEREADRERQKKLCRALRIVKGAWDGETFYSVAPRDNWVSVMILGLLVVKTLGEIEAEK